ncbi:SDR family oxidoreductase [Alcaligenaceae bacterium]|nr:SDR family oxidoreductase [Alcaligenaceae bacterium]
MDLGIRGRTALVGGASKGLGRACAEALSQEGVLVTIVSRDARALERAAGEISARSGVEVGHIACDITSPEGIEQVLEACPGPDILVTNAGGPPPGDFRDWDRGTWVKALSANMLGPIELIKGVLDGMIERHYGRIVNITSAAVKAPVENLGLSNGSRAGLTGFVSGLARQVAQHNVTINNILPGSFLTDRLKENFDFLAGKRELPTDAIINERLASVPAKRLGDPAEFGAMCAFLCSVHAGYVTGQNVLMDGGSYRGTL